MPLQFLMEIITFFFFNFLKLGLKVWNLIEKEQIIVLGNPAKGRREGELFQNWQW